MGVPRVVLGSWSRRDWLAVAIVAITATFIAGTTLMLLATSAAIYGQTATLDTDTTVRYTEALAPDGAIVLPVAHVETAAGAEAVVVGVPASGSRAIPGASLPWSNAELPPVPPPGSVTTGVDGPDSVTLRGPAGAVTRSVQAGAERSLVPPGWYVADVETVATLGTTGLLVIEPRPGERSPPAVGVVLTSAVPFLLAGAGDVLETLALVVLAGGLLAGVGVFSLTRITVLERMRTFYVVRATGGSPVRLLGLITLRGLLLSLVGTVVGGALGVGLAKYAVSVATAAGHRTAIDPSVAGPAGLALVATLSILPAVGTMAGLLAGLEAVAGPPGRLPLGEAGRRATVEGRRGVVSAVMPSLLDWRTVAPTTASLTVFVSVLLVATSVGAAFAPLSAGGGAVTEADAPHLLASRVDADVADQLRATGAAASPEILLTQVRDGEPYLVRGVDYPAFAAVTDARLVAGRLPSGTDEAVIGRDLARTLGVEVGEQVVLGGSASAAVARIRVVGLFRGSGLTDDQLLVTLPTARHLGNIGPDQVTLVRTDGAGMRASNVAAGGRESPAIGRTTVTLTGADGPRSAGEDDAGSVVVSGVDSPRYAAVGSSVEVAVTLRNQAAEPVTHVVAVAGTQRVESVRLAGGGTTTVTVAVPVESPGLHRLAVGGRTRPLTGLADDHLRLEPAVDRAPPGATLAVSVHTAAGEPATAVPVSLGPANDTGDPGDSVVTGADGTAVVTMPATPGRYVVTAADGDRSSRPMTVTVAADATRRLAYDLDVEPGAVPVGQSPTAALTVTNPWGVAADRAVTVTWPGASVTRSVTVPARGTATVTVSLEDAAGTGDRPVNASVGGRTVARSGFAVVDPATAMAGGVEAGSVAAGSALGGAVSGVFGDLQLLQLTLVLLAAVMVTVSTTAAFAQAVHARRRTVGILRATGASPDRVFRLVIVDAAVLGIASTLLAMPLAVGAVVGLDSLGALTLFGVRTAAVPAPVVLLASALGALDLALLAAALATLGLARRAPARLLAGTAGGSLRSVGRTVGRWAGTVVALAVAALPGFGGK